MDEPERPVERPVERETTIIQTGERRGGGGLIIAIVLLAIVGALAFVYFSGGLRRAADDVNVNVNVGAPDLRLPDINITPQPAPAPEQPPAEPTNKSGT